MNTTYVTVVLYDNKYKLEYNTIPNYLGIH